MSSLVSELSQAGEEVLIITFDATTGYSHKLGTEKTLAFLKKRTDILSQLAAHLAGKGDEQTGLCSDTIVLQDKVKKMFNDKYCEATGISTCFYSAVQRGDVSVQGLPAGMQFKTPGSYGAKSCMAHLNSVESIKFVKRSTDQPTSVSSEWVVS